MNVYDWFHGYSRRLSATPSDKKYVLLPFRMALLNAGSFYMYDKSPHSLYPDCFNSFGSGITVGRCFSAHIVLLTRKITSAIDLKTWTLSNDIFFYSLKYPNMIDSFSFFFAKLLLCKRLKRWCHHYGPRKENPQISVFPESAHSGLFAYCWCLSWREGSWI